MVETPFPQELTLEVMLLRLALSLLVGSMVGLEREYRDQPAGFRTHTLISIGATLLMFVSIAVPDRYGVGDPSRIAAQVVSGIGFLGAGAIIKFGADIRGLTTAASIWAVAAIGLGIGAGLYVASGVAVVLIVVVLAILNKIEKVLFEQRLIKALIIEAEGTGPDGDQVNRTIDSFGMNIRTVDLDYRAEKNCITIRYVVYVPRLFRVERLVRGLSDFPGIKRISIEEVG
ncbi:MAG: MgtC/SapB family protein [Spirochaetaceae bacterium]